MIYEIINPSDPYTIESHSLDVAFVACIFLGEGDYAFKPLEDGAEEVPLFLFGGSDEWTRKHLNATVEEVCYRVTTEKRAELADCLASCTIKGERSSLNDIGNRAHNIADKLRKGIVQVEPAPHQVFTS